jgi:hypothetical protein
VAAVLAAKAEMLAVQRHAIAMSRAYAEAIHDLHAKYAAAQEEAHAATAEMLVQTGRLAHKVQCLQEERAWSTAVLEERDRELAMWRAGYERIMVEKDLRIRDQRRQIVGLEAMVAQLLAGERPQVSQPLVPVVGDEGRE